ncbi:uncharacterized protein LOC144469396 [Augochlora pura]
MNFMNEKDNDRSTWHVNKNISHMEHPNGSPRIVFTSRFERRENMNQQGRRTWNVLSARGVSTILSDPCRSMRGLPEDRTAGKHSEDDLEGEHAQRKHSRKRSAHENRKLLPSRKF